MRVKINNLKLKIRGGFTLLEILVVVAVFSVLGILITRSIILSVGGSRKSETLVKVREGVDYATGVIERQLRNANSVDECPNTDPSTFGYIDQDGNSTTFSCVNVPSMAGFVASGSAALTGNDINVTKCSFSCVKGTGINPSVVTLDLEAESASASGIQNATVTTSVHVSLRNY